MRHPTPTRRTSRSGQLSGLGLALALLIGAGFTLAQPQPAEACSTRSGRNCTAMEELAQCLRDANDAYWKCRGPRPGWFRRIRCEIQITIDQGACIAGAPIVATLGRMW